MKVFFDKTVALFFVLCVVFIPLNFDEKGFQFDFTSFFFHKIIQFLQNFFFENAIKNIDFSSDTIALNILVLLLLFVSVLVVFVLKIFKIKTQNFTSITRTIVVYYLTYILLKYGFDKIFKAQFYLPEPNILNTKFQELSRDVLYWSTIGTSRFYCISLGIIEVITAVLLLINRTRVLGLLLAIGVFLNVILVNFGFDISVKIFSVLLLLMTVFAISTYLIPLFDFFILKKQVQLLPANYHFIKQKPIYISIKFFVIGFLLIQILLPFFESRNFNDDNYQRPFLHGSYKVIFSNQKHSKFDITHLYIHRKKYLILENEIGQKLDYRFEINKLKNQIKITDYQSRNQTIYFNYSEKDSVLILNFNDFKIICKAQNWQKSRVLQNDFHWTIDEIK